MTEYEVKQGDCMSSIGLETGFFWQTLWNLPENAELKATRGNPNILSPGDIVMIPDLRPRLLAGSAGKRHKFNIKGVPAKLRIRLLMDGKPRSGEAYRLILDDQTILEGSLNSDGQMDQVIPPDAVVGKLQMLEGGDYFFINLGHLDPVDQTTGVQARLVALGYAAGATDGVLGPITIAAIKGFQEDNGLEVDGVPGPKTQNKLVEAFGS